LIGVILSKTVLSAEIKSGQNVIDEFFSEISNIEGADSAIVEEIKKLNSENKLSNTNVQNALEKLFQEELAIKNREEKW
jgi:hypothetical protein